ncbi:carbamate kinase [Enterococcus faecalis]|uniref:carbamate kinase n=1 Tax=Enterococcus TaxID=1350 RepID=UPI0012E0E274|nr:carbamate kinase [Enterococcus faecalis]MUO55512.1 carbamate kinase [Enterococcus faecalis]
MGKRVVVALGGNALGNNLTEQMTAVKQTSKAIADLIEAGYEVILSHGNGPQVGMIQLAMEEFSFNNPQYPVVPLSVCVAMSQSYIGYDLENALQEELRQRNISKAVTTIVTQVVVDENDPAFKKPTKPIGRFMTKEEAEQLVKEKNIQVMEDAGQTVIAGGGGGIPVIQEGNRLKGVNAVIDKDFCSERLAEQVDADLLVILTAVEKVCINFGKENQEALGNVSTEKMKQYAQEGQFAPGSMLPKVEAAIKFAESKPGRKTLITLLEKAKEGLSGKTGTLIENKES